MLQSAPSAHTPSNSPFRIIVVPPAEDGEPDYMVFHEHLPEPELSESAEFTSIDAALSRIAEGEANAPQFDRTALDSVVLPKRPDGQVTDEAHREPFAVGDDSIVEIVKVRRSSYTEADEEPTAPAKSKPKSLRARAGSAFRSIKNLARGNRSASTASSNRPYAQEVFASSQSTQATFATVPSTAASPPLSRRGSIILTDLFRTPSRASSYAMPVATSAQYSEDADETDDENYDNQSMAPRAPSPSPSFNLASTMRRRLSILSFTRKTRAEDPVPPASPPALSISRDSTVPSTSSSAPQTPTDESYPQPPPSAKHIADDPDRTIMEGEMHLDSLHFENFSFDADQF